MDTNAKVGVETIGNDSNHSSNNSKIMLKIVKGHGLHIVNASEKYIGL